MGPYWDNNLGFGNSVQCRGHDATGWQYIYYNICSKNYPQNPLVPFWWPTLMQDSTFVVALEARWTALRSSVFNVPRIHTQIDAYVTTLGGAAVNANFDRWPDLLGNYVWPNPPPYPLTHAEEIVRLKEWFDGRIAWLDSAISGVGEEQRRRR